MNGGLTRENSRKRALENGCIPNYNPRKVSGYRDFPPWCGRNAVQMDLQREEKSINAGGVVEAGDMKNSGRDNIMGANGVRNFEMANMVNAKGVKDREMANDVEADGVKSFEMSHFRVPSEVRSTEVVNGSGPSGVKVVTIDVEVSSNGFEKLIKEMKPLGVELLSDLENNSVKEINKTEGSEDVTLANNTVLEETKHVSRICTSVDGVDSTVGSKLSSPSQLPIMNGNIKQETSLRLKDKYCQRRVSAIRDFPPLCGRNFPRPIEEEQQRVTCGNDGLDGFEKVDMKMEAIKKKVLEEMMTTFQKECLYGVEKFDVQTKSSQKECLDGVEKFDVETESTKTLKDGSGRVPWGELLTGNAKPVVFQETLRSTVEGELMKETMGGGVGKLGAGLRDDDIEKTELRGPMPGSRTIPRSVLDNCDEDAGGSVRKEIVVYSPDMSDKRISSQNVFSSGHEVHTEVEVVQAPMAAPVLDNCDEDTGGYVGKEIVVYSPDMSDKRISSQNVFSSGHEVHMEIEVVQALRAAPVHDNCDEDTGGGGSVRKEIVVYSPDMSDKRISSQNVFSSGHEVHMEIEFVQALMAAPYCPWRKKEVTFTNSDGRERVGKVRKQNLPWRQKYKDVARRSRIKADCSGRPSRKKMVHVFSDADGSQGALAVVRDEKDFGANDEDLPQNSPASHKLHDFVLSLPAYGHNSSSHSDDRNKVRETLRLFHAICRKILQEEEAKFELDERGKSRQVANSPIRIDLLAAKIIEEKKKEVNTGKQFLGEVPGVQVGDEFQYRVELAIVGIHRSYQAGIDSMNHNGLVVATSIVASGGYADDMENGDVLMYSGQGGNATGKDNEPQDQKLESGNLALRNSLSTKTPVRVVRGWKETRASESPDSRAEIVSTYIYDGLYTVEKYWTKTGHHGKLVFMFELRRNPGQPELAWKELKKSNKYRACSGVCVNDISEGKEPFPICAVNMMDSENHPQFNYITKMMYPDWFSPIPPEGCNCTGRCSDSRKCQCAVKNGGEIPFNHNGAIVEVKPLVYECGPSCKCPPSCYNRVSQRGIKFQLEIFKTESRGWGVRCLTFIPSGSFICEYAGELLEDKEAEQRIGNDEYLFDIGQNYNDSSLKPEESVNLIKFWEEDGFTIDAAQYGNIGRFINHSCSPNLYAQNVIYDHDDKRMPHVMLFAAENIPPLQELTYHYNYSLDQVLDSNGNIKIKRCYCGTAECSGRMY